MIETGVVVDINGGPIYWHLPNGRTAGSIPDSRTLWDVFWENRETLGGFAHSHPGGGRPSPSITDVTTFAAVEAALGKALDWYITSSESLIVCRRTNLRTTPPPKYETELIAEEPSWAKDLRRLSAAP